MHFVVLLPSLMKEALASLVLPNLPGVVLLICPREESLDSSVFKLTLKGFVSFLRLQRDISNYRVKKIFSSALVSLRRCDICPLRFCNVRFVPSPYGMSSYKKSTHILIPSLSSRHEHAAPYKEHR